MSAMPRWPEQDPTSWAAFAASDLAYARLGQNDPEVWPSQVAFHAQQAAEKAIKAAMVKHNVTFPKTHDLEGLIALWKTAGQAWPAELDNIPEMTVFAVRARYPGDIDPPTWKDVAAAIETAEKVLAWAQSVIGPSD